MKKPDKKDIENIKIAFDKMQTRNEFVALLNMAKPFVYGDKALDFHLKQITWHAYKNDKSKNYRTFNIKKKSGALRSIHAPVEGLKAIQKTISFILQIVFIPHPAASGFVKEKSIVDNAKLHVGSRYIYNIDLKDFFSSINQARVWACFKLQPFKLFGESDLQEIMSRISWIRRGTNRKPIYFINGNFQPLIDKTGKEIIFKQKDIDALLEQSGKSQELDWDVIKDILSRKTIELASIHKEGRGDINNLISSLCCTSMVVEKVSLETGLTEKLVKKVLPQGAPTSPVITNIVCQRLDFYLTAAAKRFGVKYSRYADDITFSSGINIFAEKSDFRNKLNNNFLQELDRILAQEGFIKKDSKTRLQQDGQRKEVTGLLVNDKVNVQKRYLKQLRMWIYYWEKYGYAKAEEIFLKDYQNTSRKEGNPRLEHERVDRWNVKQVQNSNGINMSRKVSMQAVLKGKLDFLKMVRGEGDKRYSNLKYRINSLDKEYIVKSKMMDRQSHLEDVITTFMDQGIDDALKLYKSKPIDIKN